MSVSELRHDRPSGRLSRYPGVCLQAFPSFPSHPLPALLLAPFLARQLTLVPRSLLIDRTETLATHAIYSCSTRDNACACSDYFKNSTTSATSEDNEVRYSVNKSRAEFSLKLTIKNLL